MPASSTRIPRGARSKQDQIQVYFADNTYRLIPCGAETVVQQILEELRERKVAEHSQADGLFIVTPGHCAIRARRLDGADRPLAILQSSGSAFKFVYKELHDEEPSIQVEPVKGIRSGILEKHSKDGKSWKARHFVLGTDRIWYWKTESSEEFSRSYLPMMEMEKVMEHPEQKSVFTIVTRKRIYVLRARSFQDRDGWVLALTKQVAITNENAWIDKVENTLASLERLRARTLDDALETCSTYVGTVRSADSTRDLFKTFALDTCVDGAHRRDLAQFLDQVANGWDPNDVNAAYHASCETYIFPLFQTDHIFQRTLEHLLIAE